MSHKILITAPYMLPVLDRFRPQFDANDMTLITPHVQERLEEADLLPLIGNVDGVISGDDRFTRRVLQAAPRLKVIAKWGTGIDSIDQDACAELGIAIRNTPNAFSEPVADSVLGYMLAFSRNLPFMDTQMKAGIWEKIPGRALRECVLGIIGLGNVGKAVARRATSFGMRIVATDPRQPPAEFLQNYPVEMVAQEQLLSEADFVSINCDLNPTSHHLMNATTLQQMKQSAVVINTARGPIIDEQSLVAALQNGTIAGAALDVFEDEPLPSNSLLRQMSNVMLAPHNSNSSPQAWEYVHQNTINQLFDVLKQQT